MGQCTAPCSSRGSIESAISDFLANMKIRNYQIDDISKDVKTKIISSGISDKKWMELVEKIFKLDIANNINEEYNVFWLNSYKDFEIAYLILAILLFCQKDTTRLKQNILGFVKFFKLSDKFYESEDKKYQFISKETITKLLTVYCNLISYSTIDSVCLIRGFDDKLKREMEKSFSKEKISAFVEGFIKNTENTAINNEYSVKNSEGVEIFHIKNYVDFDYFFEHKYSELLDDGKIRDRIIESVAKSESKGF